MRISEDVIVFEGDSLSAIGQVQNRLDHLFSHSQTHNVATGGETIEQMIAQAETQVDSLYDASGSNRLFIWAGMNNVLDGRAQTAQEVYELIKGYCLDRQAVGWDVTVSTLPISQGLADTDKLLELNALLRANWAEFADELIDIGMDARFQDATSEYFAEDHLHFSYAGNEAIADIIDARYLPTTAEKQTLVYYDLGEVTFFEEEGEVGMLSSGGAYASGAPIGGALWYGMDGAAHRVTYNNLGDSLRLDMNGDDAIDLLSVGGSYQSGAPIGGAVWYDLNAVMHRITYNSLGEYQAADLDGDGEIELISNNGQYGSGANIGGSVWYDLNGAMHRLSYFDLGDFRVADWDGDGAMEVLSNMGQYSNGSSLNGMMLVELDGSYRRVNYYNAGEDYQLLDLNGDGAMEVFSTDASYLSGTKMGGAVTFDQSGAMHRFTYNTLGNYQAADVMGDGDLEIISTGDYYNPSTRVGGTVIYDSNGSMTRLNYFEMDEFQLLDFDNDGALELITGSARYGSGAEVGGLVMFELEGNTYSFQRLAYGSFDDYQIVDTNQDDWLDVVNQTDSGLQVHYYLQAELF